MEETTRPARDDGDTLDIFVARQPIYDRRMELAGYELLYRHADVDHACFEDGDLASSAVISASFLHIGIDTLVGSAPAFLNVPRRFIVDPSMAPFFEGQVVLEILETVEPDDEVIAGLQRLKAQGHRIALDDFTYCPKREPLLALADYVKLDVLRHSPEELRTQLALVRRHDVAVIAEKVETPVLHAECEAMGFDYFQGFFYCRPKTVQKRVLNANEAVVLQLLQQLEDPDADIGRIELLLAQDVGLAYKLLRYVNSAAFAKRREVESLRDALTLVGLDRIRDWACLILMGRVATGKPNELMVTGMVRARMCERLAERFRPELQRQMFVVGLFSIIDALFDSDMMTLLDDLCLSTAIKLALLEGDGEQGDLLQRVIAYQQGQWEHLTASDIPNTAYFLEYLDALQWADEAIADLVSKRG